MPTLRVQAIEDILLPAKSARQTKRKNRMQPNTADKNIADYQARKAIDHAK